MDHQPTVKFTSLENLYAYSMIAFIKGLPVIVTTSIDATHILDGCIGIFLLYNSMCALGWILKNI